MPNIALYNQHDLAILEPLGGIAFVEKVVKTIRTADAAAYGECQSAFTDIAHCDVIGEFRRSKINEAIVGLATAMGLDCAHEKPGRQRYNNVVIRAKGTLLTVARSYGRNHVSRPSGFRSELAQMRMDFFDESGTPYVAPDDDVRVIVLAYEVGMTGDHPVVTKIELQEIGTSPADVTYRIDLGAKAAGATLSAHDVVFDDFDIKPKEGLMRKNA